MMNKFYRPIFLLSRLFCRSALNNQLIQRMPQVFSERILLDLRKIESIWHHSKNSKVINKYLYKCCSENCELSSYVVGMIQHACNRISPESPDLVREIVNVFSIFAEDNKVSFSITFDEKISLLSTVLNCRNYEILQLVCNAFKLHDQPLIYKDFIESLIKERKFYEAVYLVSVLHLQREFDIKEILLPLLLEGNTRDGRIYMTGHPDIQLKAAKYLDGYLYIKDFSPSESHKQPRKLIKTLSSLINIFRIPLDNCPNLQFIRRRGAINLLIKRRDQQSISEASWEDMIKNIVKDNEDLKKHVIQKLVRNKDMKTVVKMTEILNVTDPELYISEAVKKIGKSSVAIDDDLSEDSSDSCGQENFDIVDISDHYLKFPLRPEDIIVIDNKDDFMNSINEICQSYNMVGIDSEWKPHFGLSKEKLSLIQLAVRDKVYIFDLLLLANCLDIEDWDKLLGDIFRNPKIIKLGCGIISDVHMILESVKGTEEKTGTFSNLLDMTLFYNKLQEAYPVEMLSDSDKSSRRGLSALCDIILGKPLNKEERLCDWEKRPLMQRQLEYAALDAHCLLQMYDKLKEDSIQKNMKFDHYAKVAILHTNNQLLPKKKRLRKNNSFPAHNSIPIEQFKIVMDSTFESQGKELRKYGADVIIVNDINSADKVVELSEKEGRIVVCSENLHDQIKHRVKQECCYFLSSSKQDQIQVSHLLRHFNVKVSQNGIFSRCIVCNSSDGVKLSTEDVKVLHRLDKTHSSMNSVLQDNLTYFNSGLQSVLCDILNSGVAIKFLSQGSLSSESNFLCKSCGNIS